MIKLFSRKDLFSSKEGAIFPSKVLAFANLNQIKADIDVIIGIHGNYKDVNLVVENFMLLEKKLKINFIVINSSVNLLSFNRIVKRSRNGESNIPLEYLSNCHKYHNNMLDVNIEDCFCKDQLVLNGDIDIYENKEQLNEWINHIEKFIL